MVIYKQQSNNFFVNLCFVKNMQSLILVVFWIIPCLLLYFIPIFVVSIYSDIPRKEIMDELKDVKIISLESGEIVQNKSFNALSTSALDVQRVAFFEKMN